MNRIVSFILGLVFGLGVASGIYTINLAALHEQVDTLKDDYADLLDRQEDLENVPWNAP